MKEKAEMTREELIALGWMKKPSDKMQEKPKNQLTAVEWLVDKLDIFATEEEMNIIEQAKEMEKEQMIKFAKHCLDKSIDLDILMAYNQVEIEYTNQTFKSE